MMTPALTTRGGPSSRCEWLANDPFLRCAGIGATLIGTFFTGAEGAAPPAPAGLTTCAEGFGAGF